MLGQNFAVWSRGGRGGGLLSLGDEGLLGLPVHLALLLAGRLKILHSLLVLPSDLVRDTAKHAEAASRLQARDAEGIGHNLM